MTQQTSTPRGASSASPLLTPEELAAYLGVAKQTIYNRRSTGAPLPPAIHIGRAVRYRLTDVNAWLQSLPSSAHASMFPSTREPSQESLPKRRGRPTKAQQVLRRGQTR